MLMEVYTDDYKTLSHQSGFDNLPIPNNYDDSISERQSVKSLQITNSLHSVDSYHSKSVETMKTNESNFTDLSR